MFTFERLYHYTTIHKLQKILQSGCIQFSPVCDLDDITEQKTKDARSLRKYCLVSSWTAIRDEMLPMWKQYSDLQCGVRIDIERQPFLCDNAANTRNKCYPQIESGEPLYDTLNKDGMMWDVFLTSLPDEMLCNVTYTNNRAEIYPRKVLSRFKFDMNYYGTRKLNFWDFQNEYRFRYFIVPRNYLIGQGGFNTNTPASSEEIDVPMEFRRLKLNPKSIENMKITLAPCITKCAKELVRDCTAARGISEKNIVRSFFSGKIKPDK